MFFEDPKSKFEKLRRLDTFEKEDLAKTLKKIHLPKIKKTLYEKFSENLKAGLTVGLVNLPLCISFAVAGSSIPRKGVLAGIWGGILGGIIGGSYYNVIGPAGALCAFMKNFEEKWGKEAFPFCTFVCGLITILVLYGGLGKYIDIFPVSVNEGFTCGLAFSIFFGQMENALGLPHIARLKGEPEDSAVTELMKIILHIGEAKGSSFLIFIITIISLFILTKCYPRVPWVVPMTICGIILGTIDKSTNILSMIALGDKFQNVHFAIVEIPDLTTPEHPYMIYDPNFYIDCIPTAFVVILECLIAGKIADAITNTKFNVDRELKALYISNLVVGGLGGIPVTASLPRTALNIRSGATHKYSSLISSIVLMILSAIFMRFFVFLPMPVIAGIVGFISIRMINFEECIKVFREDKKNFKLLIFVFLVSIFVEAIVGIMLGLLIYLLIFSEQMIDPYSEIIITDENEKKVFSKLGQVNQAYQDIPPGIEKYVIYRFVGVINYMNIDIHKERILSFAKSDDSTIILSLRYMAVIDPDAIHALKILIEEIETNDTTIKIPKNYLEDFLPDGDSQDLKEIVANIEKMPVVEEKEVKKRMKIILTGITKSKLKNFHDKEWLSRLKSRRQLYTGDEEVMETLINH